MTNPRTRVLLVTVIAVIVAGGAFICWRSVHRGQQTQNQPTPPPQADEQTQAMQENQKRHEAAQGCLDEALKRLHQSATGQPRQRESIDLEESWLEYLQRIQAEGNYPNWSGPPCDLYLRNHPGTVSQAVDLGLLNLEVRGNGLQEVTVTVSAAPSHPIVNQSFVIPVGTLFTSSSSGTQSMVAATTIRFQFYPATINTTDDSNSSSQNRSPIELGNGRPQLAVFHPGMRAGLRNVIIRSSIPQSVTQNVPSYCINRWREVPESDSHFSVSQLDQNNPLRKLVACLDESPVEHGTKQLAVWMISDHLLDLTPQELSDKFFAESDTHAVQTATEFADAIKKRRPDISEDKLEQIRNIPPEQFQQIRTELLKAQAADEVKSYREVTRPLLEGCGIDVSNSAFFR
jgi:hypothetical protein